MNRDSQNYLVRACPMVVAALQLWGASPTAQAADVQRGSSTQAVAGRRPAGESGNAVGSQKAPRASGRRIAPFPGQVTTDPASRQVRAALALEPRRTRYGLVTVRNRSQYPADVYASLDDDVTPWYFVATLRPGYRLTVRLPRNAQYLLAAEENGNEEGQWDWGPASFYLRSGFTWSLLN